MFIPVALEIALNMTLEVALEMALGKRGSSESQELIDTLNDFAQVNIVKVFLKNA